MIKPYYSEDGITIYNANCQDVLPLLSVSDLVLTDPPYGVLSQTGSAATRRSGDNPNKGIMDWDVAPLPSLMQAILGGASTKRSGADVTWNYLQPLATLFGTNRSTDSILGRSNFAGQAGSLLRGSTGKGRSTLTAAKCIRRKSRCA